MFNRAKMLLLACLVVVAMAAMSAVAFANNGVNWDTNKIVAHGEGVAPANAINPAQAKMMARRAAVVDAYRQLAEVVNGVQVDSTTTVQNMLAVNDNITTHVNALIKGARVINEYITADGGYAVEMEVDLFGISNSLASAVMPTQAAAQPFPALAANVPPTPPMLLSLDSAPAAPVQSPMMTAPQYPASQPLPQYNPAPVATAPVAQAPVAPAPVAPAPVAPAPAVQAPAVQAPAVQAPVAPAPAAPAAPAPEVQAPVVQAPVAQAPVAPQSAAPAIAAPAAAGGYTGLIVDCSGLGLRPAMSPVIKNDMGTPIYGYKNLDSKVVIGRGMAGYTTNIANASRAGNNPLVVRAVSIEGSNPVISTADANRVLLENEVSKFLDQTNVVFIR